MSPAAAPGAVNAGSLEHQNGGIRVSRINQRLSPA